MGFSFAALNTILLGKCVCFKFWQENCSLLPALWKLCSACTLSGDSGNSLSFSLVTNLFDALDFVVELPSFPWVPVSSRLSSHSSSKHTCMLAEV